MRFGVAIGERVGQYEITGELGSGGMGVVYRAKHVMLHRPAAIKVLRPELGAHTSALDRFLNEARAATAIRHPGIVEIYDYGNTAAGWAYIAMELLTGATLAARIGERGPLPIVDALILTRRIAGPLAVAHDAGIIHRDLKPENVFLIRDHEGGAVDQVKLLDFGIARLESAATRTTTGLILGTPAYMSPEQCRGITDCDHRADLYSLGCVVYEMLVGEPPFGARGSMTELIAAHIGTPAPELPRAVAPELRRLVARLLAKSPAERPANALEVIAELDRYLATTSAGVAALRPPAPPVRAGMTSSVRIAIAAAAGLALSLAGLGAWYRTRRTTPVDEPAPPLGLARGSVIAAPPASAPAPPPVTITAVPKPAPPPKLVPVPAPAPVKPPPPLPRTTTSAPIVTKPEPRPTGADDVLGDLGSARQPDVNTVVTP